MQKMKEPIHSSEDSPLYNPTSRWVLESIVIHEELEKTSEEMTLAFDQEPVCPKPESKSFISDLMSSSPRINTEVKRFASLRSLRDSFKNATEKKVPKLNRTVSSAQRGLKSLRFLNKASAGKEGDDGWRTVEKQFDKIKVNGKLPKEKFGECIGMADSKEFAKELFDALARSMNLQVTEGISKEELREFWAKMADQNFDSRLQIFFDMCDKNGDGKLSEDEVKEVIALSCSANNLAKLKGQAATYASLIMEKLDPRR